MQIKHQSPQPRLWRRVLFFFPKQPSASLKWTSSPTLHRFILVRFLVLISLLTFVSNSFPKASVNRRKMFLNVNKHCNHFPFLFHDVFLVSPKTEKSWDSVWHFTWQQFLQLLINLQHPGAVHNLVVENWFLEKCFLALRLAYQLCCGLVFVAMACEICLLKQSAHLLIRSPVVSIENFQLQRFFNFSVCK